MKREGGYTVLETGLAIAMSATLVLLTFGLAAMVGRGRFRDSLVTTQSFIKQQYNEVRSGINSRLTGGSGPAVDTQTIGGSCGNNLIPGNNNGCYVIGRLLTFDNDGGVGRVQASFIIAVVAANSKWPDSTKPGLDNLVKDSNVTLYALTDTSGNDAGLNPTIKQMGGNSLEKVWLLHQNGGLETLYSAHPSIVGQNNMAILRSPVDGSLVVASKIGLSAVTGSNIAGLMKLGFQGAVTNMSQDDKLALAVRNQGLGYPGGVICIPGGDNPAGTSNNFNVAGGNWDWDNGLRSVVASSDVIKACGNMDQ